MRFRIARKTQLSFVLIVAVLFVVTSLPLAFSAQIRSFFVGSAVAFSTLFVSAPSPRDLAAQDEIAALRLENHMLAAHIMDMEISLEQSLALKRHVSRLRDRAAYGREGSAFLQRRCDEAEYLGCLSEGVIPARVVYRDPASWSSSLWVGIGSEDNKRLGYEAVVRNSPVVYGLDVVGVVDYVGERQSRVRLITDSGLSPSVRAARGLSQNVYWANHIEALIEALDQPLPLTVAPYLAEDLLGRLIELREGLLGVSEGAYLAKGELRGGGMPLWRAPGQLLRGVGFNYDFADAEGGARDLRTGALGDSTRRGAALPLVQEGDMLVTTGLDGVFPPGLFVARVSHVHVLREGSSTYELEATPLAANLNELSLVFILPPVAFDAADQPSFAFEKGRRSAAIAPAR